MANTVLIADDDEDLVSLLSMHCQAMGLEVLTAADAMSALIIAQDSSPDLVILDVGMPSGSGLSACEMMATHQDLKSIPVIVLTGSSSEEVVRRCHELCAYYVQKAPDVWGRIEPLIEEILQSEKQSPTALSNLPTVEAELETETLGSESILDTVFAVLGVEEGESLLDGEEVVAAPCLDEPWVLSIEDDDDVALALKLRLQEMGVKVIRASAGSEGYRKAFLNEPRAIILDYELPGGNGDYVLRRLKESPATCEIPVIVLTGRRETAIERQMRALGASEFLTKPIQWNLLRKALGGELDKTATSTNAATALA